MHTSPHVRATVWDDFIAAGRGNQLTQLVGTRRAGREAWVLVSCGVHSSSHNTLDSPSEMKAGRQERACADWTGDRGQGLVGRAPLPPTRSWATRLDMERGRCRIREQLRARCIRWAHRKARRSAAVAGSKKHVASLQDGLIVAPWLACWRSCATGLLAGSN